MLVVFFTLVSVDWLSSFVHVLFCLVPRPCFEGEFRLRNQTYDFNGYQTFSGRLEFCQNGTFTPVCSEGFGQMEAQTVCRLMYSQYYGKQWHT